MFPSNILSFVVVAQLWSKCPLFLINGQLIFVILRNQGGPKLTKMVFYIILCQAASQRAL